MSYTAVMYLKDEEELLSAPDRLTAVGYRPLAELKNSMLLCVDRAHDKLKVPPVNPGISAIAESVYIPS